MMVVVVIRMVTMMVVVVIRMVTMMVVVVVRIVIMVVVRVVIMMVVVVVRMVTMMVVVVVRIVIMVVVRVVTMMVVVVVIDNHDYYGNYDDGVHHDCVSVDSTHNVFLIKIIVAVLTSLGIDGDDSNDVTTDVLTAIFLL